ncbi:major capsid protein P2 [Burkholderia arboris]|uniref:major capsid protein P2 n=1 Tax=Burkholderia arboris TaxID=488730 RepID=UPI00210C2BCA|nr:major capsid protein P2 [Burkholderia arboris]UTV53233.1 major capsid protein P2 [Burkholderia arboris]
MRKERLVNFQNIAPGQVAILTCPIGPTYEKFKINLIGGLLVQHVSLIVGKINDKPFFTVTGADLLAENLYEGRSNPNTVLILNFLRDNAKSAGTQSGPTATTAETLLTAVPSALMQKLTFEITLLPTAPAGCNMQAFAQLNDPTKNNMVLKQLQTAISFPYAQDNDVPLAVGRAGAIIKKLFIHQSNYASAAWAATTAYTVGTQVSNGGNVYLCTVAGTSAGSGGPSGNGTAIVDGGVTWQYVAPTGGITFMQVRNQGVIIWEGAPADAQGDQTDYQKVAQPGLTVIDFDLQGFREKWLNTAMTQNVFVRLTTTGVFNMRLYQSIVDPIQRA